MDNQIVVKYAVKYLINPEDPKPLLVDREMLSDALREGDIVTLGNAGDPARDWRTGIPVPPNQRFRITVKP